MVQVKSRFLRSPVHCLDVGQHSESPVAHEGKEDGNEEPDPHANGQHLSAVPASSECVLVEVEHLGLHSRESNADGVLLILDVVWRKHPGIVAAEGQAQRGRHFVPVQCVRLMREYDIVLNSITI